MTYNYRCLLPQLEYLSYFTLYMYVYLLYEHSVTPCGLNKVYLILSYLIYSHVLVMSKLGQLRTCLNLMTARQNSFLSPLKDLSISITYLLLSLGISLGILRVLPVAVTGSPNLLCCILRYFTDFAFCCCVI